MKGPTLNKLSKDVTLVVSVNLGTEFKIRMSIAIFLMKIAALVLGCGLEVEEEKK